MPWNFAKALDIGGRSEQQDRVCVFNDDRQDRHLLVVADGMGGHSEGARAAQAVLNVAQEHFSAERGLDPQSFLESVCAAAHRSINNLNIEGEHSPGSTCVFLYLSGSEAYWAHIGDSRLYQFRKGVILARTEDHTVGQLMLAQGGAGDCPHDVGDLQEKLYMRLGGDSPPEPEFGATEASCGDVFLICSDGFWATVQPGEVIEALDDCPLEAGGAERLMELARQRAGKSGDNISFALAQWSLEPRVRVQRFVSRLMSGMG
jgi:serine/threonine protein phosphatase PrpC